MQGLLLYASRRSANWGSRSSKAVRPSNQSADPSVRKGTDGLGHSNLHVVDLFTDHGHARSLVSPTCCWMALKYWWPAEVPFVLGGGKEDVVLG